MLINVLCNKSYCLRHGDSCRPDVAVPTYCFVSGLTSCLFTAADKYRQSLRTVSKAVSQVLTGELELEEQKKADRNQA